MCLDGHSYNCSQENTRKGKKMTLQNEKKKCFSRAFAPDLFIFATEVSIASVQPLCTEAERRDVEVCPQKLTEPWIL